jgi:hypothetical protein
MRSTRRKRKENPVTTAAPRIKQMKQATESDRDERLIYVRSLNESGTIKSVFRKKHQVVLGVPYNTW